MQKTVLTIDDDPQFVKTGPRASIAGIAAVASLLGASACCLPLLPFVAAAGLAGSATFLTALQPYLLGASVILIGYGFYQAGRAKKCNRRPNLLGTILLWSSAAIVFVSLVFPQAVAGLLAG